MNRVDPTGHIDIAGEVTGYLVEKAGGNRAAGAFFGSLGGSFVPGNGEVSDVTTIFSLDWQVGTGERLLATASLVLNVGTLGLAPNASGPVKNATALMEEAAATSSGVVSHLDEAAEAVRGAPSMPRADFIVTPGGAAIPTDPSELRRGLGQLEDVSTNPSASRKFAGEDSTGPVRVRVEKAHPNDPSFEGPRDPVHTQDHIHIDRRENGTTGKWRSSEKVEYDWPF